MASLAALSSSASTPLFTLFKTPTFSFTKTSFSTSSSLHIIIYASSTKTQTQIVHSCSISSSSSPNSSRSLYSISPVSSRLARFVKFASSSNASEEDSALSSDVIVLDVKGIMCEGCAGSVKRMLESQPQVSSANVNLASETATVLPVLEAKVTHNWQKEVGETLAKHLTNCGFQSNLRDKLQSTQAMVLPSQEAAFSRRQAILSGGMSLVAIFSTVTPLPVRAEEKEPKGQDEDDIGIIDSLKSLFDPNEKTKSGKVLPKAYLKSAREVVKTLRESVKEDPKDNAKFRRTADAAKESIQEYLNDWKGQKTVIVEESYVAIEKVIRALAGFYSKAGPSAMLPEDVKSNILDDLNTADASL